MSMEARTSKNPKKIRLAELPETTSQWLYTEHDASITKVLQPLIGHRPFKIELNLTPQSDVYLIQGTVKVDLPLVCSKCGIDFDKKLDFVIHELAIVDDQKNQRPQKQGRANHLSDYDTNAPFCHYLDSQELNVAELFHEWIASSEPIRPLGGENCDNECKNYEEAVKMGWIQPDDNSEGASTHRPFSILGQLKN